MHCPFCHNPDSRVVDTRIADDGASIRRRRECTACKRRFTTLETSSFQVVKRSGAVEPFSRNKVIAGVRKACQGRPVSDHDLAVLAQQVEETLRQSGVSSVSSGEVGQAILPYLSRLDVIAYLRFASVYRAFTTLDDFEDAITALRERGPEPETPGAGASAAGEAGGDGDVVGEADARPARAATPTAVAAPTATAAPTVTAAPAPMPSTAPRRPERRRRPKRSSVPEDAPTLLDD